MESKRIVCGSALASVNRNTHPLGTDCVTCKTNGNQTAHLPHFKAIVMIEEGKCLYFLNCVWPSGQASCLPSLWLLIVNSGCHCHQSKPGYIVATYIHIHDILVLDNGL